MTTPVPRERRPWRFHCTATTIELHADVVPDGDLMRVCGAALLNLRLAVRALGVRPGVQLLPDPRRPHLLAVVVLHGHTEVRPADRRMADAIITRRDHLGPFRRLAVSTSVVAGLRAAARSEQAWLPTITGACLPILRGLVNQAHGALPDRPPDPLVAVVATFHDSPLARLQAGQATQRVLLAATVAGLSASFVAEVLETPMTRGRLRESVVGGLWPQAVLRLGTPVQ